MLISSGVGALVLTVIVVILLLLIWYFKYQRSTTAVATNAATTTVQNNSKDLYPNVEPSTEYKGMYPRYLPAIFRGFTNQESA